VAETTILNGNLRTNTGKGFARASRRAGRIPAIIYGDKQDTISIDIEEREYRKLITQSGIFSRLLDLNVDGKSNIVLTRDIQFHPVSENPLHVDFLRIGKGSTITVSIPVSFINEELSPGLKTGGVLNTVRFELELECPADNIPEKIEINLEGLVVGDSIKISTVELPDGVKPTITDRDFTIATIAAPTKMADVSTEVSEETDEEDAEAVDTNEEDKDSKTEN
jgi:large subunit ribosomal protein L25